MKKLDFHDLFSAHASDYSKFRPGYPDELFSYLAAISPQHDLAWDCATGNGQAAVKLAEHFTQVIATDASREQIENAIRHPAIQYRVEAAETSRIDDNSINLVTVAQALHWFNLDTFEHEVCRVLTPGGHLAVWSYNLLNASPEIDELTWHLYHDILGDYWSFKRQLVENDYQDITFLRLLALQDKTFTMKTQWALPHFLGYLSTWSALKKFQEKHKRDPLKEMIGDYQNAWYHNHTEDNRSISWPLICRVWQLPE